MRLQANTMDTLSALAELIRMVDATGRCEATAHTYDGRRAVAIEAIPWRGVLGPRPVQLCRHGAALRLRRADAGGVPL